jgi:hypothetical protein
LGTIFYLAYLAFEYPQNLALQRFPVGKWMVCVSQNEFPQWLTLSIQSLNIMVWAMYVLHVFRFNNKSADDGV